MSGVTGLTVAGVDLSFTSTGVTRLCFEFPGDGVHLLYPFQRRIRTTGKADDTHDIKARRMERIAQDVVAEAVDSDGTALVVLEGPSYHSTGGASHDIAGLWWTTFRALRVEGVPVAVVAPAQRAKYATGKGAGPDAGKDRVLAAAIRRYPQHFDIDGNDVADSTLLAAMGCRHLGYPVEESLPQTHLAAMNAVRWPQIPTREGAPAP